jgi:hypothetical protein
MGVREHQPLFSASETVLSMVALPVIRMLPVRLQPLLLVGQVLMSDL